MQGADSKRCEYKPLIRLSYIALLMRRVSRNSSNDFSYPATAIYDRYDLKPAVTVVRPT